MTESVYEDLPRAKRRRLVAFAVLRPMLTTTCLVVLYFVVPISGRSTSGTAFWLAAGLLGVGVLIALQARFVARARFPRVRAIEALATSAALFILIFAATYFLMAQSRPTAFSEHLTRVDALYFTITVFSSVGFGDITARSEPARIVAMIQMLGDLLVVGVAVRILLGAVQVGLRRRTGVAPHADGGTADGPAGPSR